MNHDWMKAGLDPHYAIMRNSACSFQVPSSMDALSRNGQSGARQVPHRARWVIALTLLVSAGVVLALPDQVGKALEAVGFSFYKAPEFIASPRVYVRVTERNGTRYLYGGKDPTHDFDISGWRLNVDQLKYGLGREWFPALIEPEFISLKQADESFLDRARVLAVSINGDARIYPLSTLKQYEVVNDKVGGVPVCAAYCYLAQLGAIYDRRLGTHTLTFALSGYTYHDPKVWEGLNAFVLWDRETESLWWPPIGRAVSGPLRDAPLKLLDQVHWAQTTWGKAKAKYPGALILKGEVAFDPPHEWKRLDVTHAEIATTRPEDEADDIVIAPRWNSG